MKVTVLTGGTSSERDVAIASAVQVIGALRSLGHEVAVVDTARGFIPESEESSMLSGTVGVAPPSIDQLQTLERGLLLSGLGEPAGRAAMPTCCSLHSTEDEVRTGRYRPSSR